MTSELCPCDTGEPYDRCCQPRHDATSPAPTAPDLMRSRFSAFAMGDAAYLRETWHPSTRPAGPVLDGGLTWLRLEILDTVDGGPADDHGVVEFRAYYRVGGLARTMRERSSFVRVQGRWRYVSGTVR